MKTYHLFFKKLAYPLYIDILVSLEKKERSVQGLCGDLKVEQSKLSHALKSLKVCNIVHVKKKGKSRIYSLNKQTILPILKLIDLHEKTFCKKCYMRKK